jgi:hypothetical protein
MALVAAVGTSGARLPHGLTSHITCKEVVNSIWRVVEMMPKFPRSYQIRMFVQHSFAEYY